MFEIDLDEIDWSCDQGLGTDSHVCNFCGGRFSKSETPECIHYHSTRALEYSTIRSGVPLGRIRAEETPKKSDSVVSDSKWISP